MGGTGLAVGVGVVVRDRVGRVLLGRREKVGEPVSWALPGGTLEPGESFEDAARRELLEETGLVADAVEVIGLGLTVMEGPDLPGWTAAAVADDVAGVPQLCAPHEFSELAWFEESTLPADLFGPTRVVLDLVTDGRSKEVDEVTYCLRRWERATRPRLSAPGNVDRAGVAR